MLRYLAKRLLTMLPMLLGITLISFVVIHLAPGEPTDIQTELNPKASAELKERLRQQYNLDKPLLVQYGLWLGRLAQLDFGTSFSQDRRPVFDKIVERLPITIMINVLSIAVILAISVPIGILSATRRNSLFDRGTTIFVFLGFATPSFWLALLLMDLFGVRLGLFPIAGLKSLGHEYLSWGGAGPRHRPPPGPPRLRLRLRGACRLLALHALQHAGGDPSGLHPHRPGQGAPGAGGRL